MQIEIIKMRDSQKIQLDWASVFVARMQGGPYENDIPDGQIKIIKNKESQKIQLDWASIFVAKM